MVHGLKPVDITEIVVTERRLVSPRIRQGLDVFGDDEDEEPRWEKLLANELDGDRGCVVVCIGIEGIGGF